MALHVWLSVQSDSGITMGELGKISADTDSKLIASTLMALKDIVSVEASSRESQFMTGEVETSSFGIFAIALSKETRLELSYIISTTSGEAVDDEVKDLVQNLCNNFGKQLTLIGDMEKYIKTGASIPKDLITKAYINAVTIVQLDTTISFNAKKVRREYKQIVSSLINDPKKLSNAISDIFSEKIKENERYWFNGVLTNEAKEILYQRFADHIIYLMGKRNPLTLLYSNNPRNEEKNIYSFLKETIPESINDKSDFILQNLTVVMENGLTEYINNISVKELHMLEQTIYNEFVKRAILRAKDDNPLILFKKLYQEQIKNTFEGSLPEINYKTAAEMFIDSIKPAVSKKISTYIESYYRGFIQGLGKIRINQPAVDFMTIFASNFLPLDELISNMKDLKVDQESWLLELAKAIQEKERNTLKVESVDEANLISNAAISAVTNTTGKIVTTEFLFESDEFKSIVERISQYMVEVGPTIKAATILLTLLQTISTKCETNVEFMTPSYRDLIGISLKDRHYDLIIDDDIVEINQKYLGFGAHVAEFDGKSILFEKFLGTLDEFEINIDRDKKLKINMNQIEVDPFLQLVNDFDLIIDSVELAGKRRYHQFIDKKFDLWKSKILSDLKNLNDGIKEENIILSDFIKWELDIPPYMMPEQQFGSEINDVILNHFEKAEEEINNEYEKTIRGIQDEAEAENQFPNNIYKRINKFGNKIEKLVDSIKDDLRDEIYDFANQAHNEIKQFRDEIKRGFYPEKAEILRFNQDLTNLLPSTDEILSKIDSYTNTTNSISKNHYDRFPSNIAMDLFENPPSYSFEPAYDEIINNNLSSEIKEILNETTNKREFEEIIKERGRTFVTKLIEELNELFRILTNMYVDKNGIVTSDSGQIRLHLGRIPVKRYTRQKFMDELLSLPGLTVERETDSWLLSYGFTKLNKMQKEIPNIVTFSDTVNYIHREIFLSETNDIFNALAEVCENIETKSSNKLSDFRMKLANTIYQP